MQRLYEGSRLEHIFVERNTSKIIVGGGTDWDSLSCSQVHVLDSNLNGVIKYYSEKGNASNIFIRVSNESYERSIVVSRDHNVGLYFRSGFAEEFVKNVSNKSLVELDNIASCYNISVNKLRMASNLSRLIPRSLSVQDAEFIMAKSYPGSEREAINALSNAIQKDRVAFYKYRSLKFKNMIESVQLSSTKPGEEASRELGCYADKIFRDGGIHVLQDGMGKGKTRNVVRSLIQSALKKGEKVSFITHRIAISESPEISDLVSNYQDETIKGIEHKLDALSVTINQLGYERFLIHVEASDVVVFDEGAQVFRHFMQDGFKGADRILIIQAVRRILNSARLVLVCDAYIDQLLFDVLSIGNRPIKFTQGKIDNSDTVLMLGRPSSAARELMAGLGRKKIMVGCDSRILANAIRFYADGLRLKVLLISSETKDLPDVKSFFADPDREVCKYDVLVHTSSMQSSVGITLKYFEEHYCFFSGIISIDDARQYIRRDRTARCVKIGVADTRNFINAKVNDYLEIIVNDSGELDVLRSRYMYRRDIEKNNFQQWLSLAFEDEGYAVTQLRESEICDKEAESTLRLVKIAAREFSTRTILDTISNKISQSGPRGSMPTDDYRLYVAQAQKILRLLGKGVGELKASDVEFYQKGGELKLINLMCWLVDDSDFKKILKSETYNNVQQDLKWRRELISGVMSRLGITKSGQGVFCEDEVTSACSYVKENWKSLKILGLVKGSQVLDSLRKQHSVISDILRAMGLSKERQWRDSRANREEGSRGYGLDSVVWKNTTAYLGF